MGRTLAEEPKGTIASHTLSSKVSLLLTDTKLWEGASPQEIPGKVNLVPASCSGAQPLPFVNVQDEYLPLKMIHVGLSANIAKLCIPPGLISNLNPAFSLGLAVLADSQLLCLETYHEFEFFGTSSGQRSKREDEKAAAKDCGTSRL